MGERWAKALTLEKVSSGRFERIGFAELADGLKGNALRLEDGIRIGNKFLRSLSFRKSDTILGSNFSLYKEDLVKINGFDESYDGPGRVKIRTFSTVYRWPGSPGSRFAIWLSNTTCTTRELRPRRSRCEGSKRSEGPATPSAKPV